MTAGANLFVVTAEEPAASDPPAFAIAVARRIGWRQVLWAAAILLVVTALSGMSRWGWEKRYGPAPSHFAWSNLIVEIVFAGAVMVAVLVADEAVSRGARRWATYFAAVFVACTAGTAVCWSIQDLLGWSAPNAPHGMPVYVTALKLFLSAWLYATLACIGYVNLRNAALASARMHDAELRRAASRRRTLESRLQAMQARVEPQFLFNTLAQVRELFEHDTELAGRMLEDLIAYLRAALPHLRESSSTLGQELRLVQAYLDIVQISLRDGLVFSIAPGEQPADSMRMPPMMLLPLVDRALAHGAAPSGGRRELQIDARVDGERLRVTVADNAGAFAPSMQAPELDGLAHRLRALYADGARLVREHVGAQGSRAVLDVPLEAADDPSADSATAPR